MQTLSIIKASKGLHMVSAVHLHQAFPDLDGEMLLQRGCTWLVQFIVNFPVRVGRHCVASKGLHMVSAVHLLLDIPNTLSLLASKGLHMVSAVRRKNYTKVLNFD